MHLRKAARAHSSYTRGPACVAVPARGPGRRAACAGPLWSSCWVTVGPPPASPRARLAFHSVTREVPRTVISTLHDAIPANPQRPRLRDVYASARPWPWRVAFPKVSSSREPAGPCLHAASCSSRSPTSVCRREAASLQALLAVQHVSEPCALSLLQPCGGQQPSATSQLACSLAQRVRRSLSCAFVQLLLSLSHPRPASALRCGGNPPLRLVTFALWAPSPCM